MLCTFFDELFAYSRAYAYGVQTVELAVFGYQLNDLLRIAYIAIREKEYLSGHIVALCLSENCKQRSINLSTAHVCAKAFNLFNGVSHNVVFVRLTSLEKLLETGTK
jgi:hypothetical protein